MRSRLLLAPLVLAAVAMIWNGVLHLILIRSFDERVKHLFRAQVSFPLSLLLTLAITTLFVLGYRRFARDGSAAEGMAYGFFFGLLTGVLVDFNQYVLYPIPLDVALVWFTGGVVEFTLYGFIVAKLVARPGERRAGRTVQPY